MDLALGEKLRHQALRAEEIDERRDITAVVKPHFCVRAFSGMTGDCLILNIWLVTVLYWWPRPNGADLALGQQLRHEALRAEELEEFCVIISR